MGNIYYLTVNNSDIIEYCTLEEGLKLFPKELKKRGLWEKVDINILGINMFFFKNMSLEFNIFVCKNSSSTFDVAFFLDKINLLKDYDVVFSFKQWRGIGQFNRRWESPMGNIYATMKLPSTWSVHNFSIPLITSLYLCKYLRDMSLNTMIKWPNDIIILPESKKIAGLLSKDMDHSLFLGIGINVNTVPEIKEIHMPATSIKEILGNPINPFELFIDIVKHIFFCYQGSALGLDVEEVKRQTQQYLAFMDQEVSIVSQYRCLNRAKIIGISNTGSLKVLVDNQVINLNSGTIVLE